MELCAACNNHRRANHLGVIRPRGRHRIGKMDELEVFVAVVEAQGFSAAARRLDSTPAAVSRRVKALEQRLGVRLLQRTTRRIQLTEAGERYFAEVRRLLGELHDVEQQVQAVTGEPSGDLRIFAPMSFGQRRLAPVVARFALAHPRLRVRLHLDDSETDLVAAGADLAVRIAYPLDSSLVGRQIAQVPRWCCAAPAYLARRGAPALPADLARHDCLHYDVISERDEWTFSGPFGDEVVSVRGVFCSNNGDALAEAAIQGLGVTLLPDFIVEDALADGRLVRLLRDYERPPLMLTVLYPSRQHVPVKTRLLVEYLVEAHG
jgi:DNA-binding transcriptional LysR family regulator